MTYSVLIPRWHPTRLNKLVNSHWATAHRMKQADAQMLGVYLYQAEVPKAAGKRRVEIEIVLGKGQRAGDPDAYFKSPIDALVRLGYLKDDNRQWLDLEPVKYGRAAEMATVLRITDLG